MRLLQLYTLLFLGLGSVCLRAQVDPPTISPTYGDSVLAFDAELSGGPNTQVHYTTNGLAPAQTDQSVGQNGTVRIVTNTELKARAFDQSGQQSSVVSANYRITGAVSLAGQFALLLTSSGKVFSWGDGATGKLGNGASSDQLRPVEVIKGAGKFEDAVSISAAPSHSLVADEAGFAWSFGAGSYHRLGYNSLSNTSTPVRVLKSASTNDHLTNIVEVAAARHSSYALDGQGFVWAWGHRGNGRLGEGSTSGNQSFAVSVTLNATGNPLLSGIQKIAASEETALALGQNQLVYGWGFNGDGQLCQGHSNNNITRAVPLRLDATNLLDGAVDISAGGNFIAVVRQTAQEAGTVWTCGARSLGQLGNGSNPAGVSTYPVRVIKADGQPLTNIIQVAAGYWHALALDQSGQVWAWGHNNRGQLGDGTTTNRNVAVPVTLASGGNLTGIVYISAAGYPTETANFGSSMAISQNGTLFAWGANNQGQFGNNMTGGTNTRAVPAGNGIFASAPPPTVALAVSGAPYVSPATITLNASATSPGSTTAKVDFFRNGSLVNSDTASPYQAQVTGLSTGGHSFHAVVTNALGAATASSVVPITVVPPSVSVSTLNSPIPEASATPAKFQITRGPTFNGNLTVNFSLGGTAQPGTHYESLAQQFVTIPSGSASAEVSIQPIARVEDEGNQTVVLTVSPSASYSITSGTANLTITHVPRAAPVTIWPPPETISDVRIVKFSNSTPGATIRYTTNGTTPTLSSPSISPGELLRIPRFATIRAIATAPGYQASQELSVAYSGRAQIHAGEDLNVAISQEGQLFSWGGSNSHGQLGKGHTFPELFPFPIEGYDYLISASVGQNRLVFISSNGTSHSAGLNHNSDQFGNLGIGNMTTANFPIPQQITGGHQFVDVSTNQAHSLAITSNGSVFGWGSCVNGRLATGYNSGSYYSPTQIAVGYRSISAGVNHSLGINSDGKVVGWGGNGNYQLGLGVHADKTMPEIGKTASGVDLEGIVQVAAGDRYSLALSKNGTIWSVGLSDKGQIGRVTGNMTLFAQIPSLNGVCKISAGFAHALALMSNGTVFGWGDNSQKQISASNNTTFSAPFQLPGITNAVDISAGRNHSLILLADGSVIMLGKNSRPNPINLATKAAMPKVSHVSGHHTSPIAVTVTSLQSGAGLFYTLDGTEPTEGSQSIATGGTIPISQSCILKVKAFFPGIAPSATVFRKYIIGGRLFAGSGSTMFVSEQGQVHGFGLNSNGQLGLGNVGTQLQVVPQLNGNLNNIREIAFGVNHSVFLSANGSVFTAGWNGYGYGVLGINSSVFFNTTIPLQVIGMPNAVSIAANNMHSLALTNNGTVYAWGYNSDGQLGDGTTVHRYMPVPIAGLSEVIEIGAGYDFSAALRSDGTLYVWGRKVPALGMGVQNTAEVFASPTRCGTINDVISFSVGRHHVLAIRRDGSVWSVGHGGNGQLGISENITTTSSYLRVQSPTANSWNAIQCAAGSVHSLIVEANGKVWGFGRMGHGRLGLAMFGPGNRESDNGFSGNQWVPASVRIPFPAIAVSAAEEHSVATAYNGASTYWTWGRGDKGQNGNGQTWNQYVPLMISFGSYSDTDGDGLPDWQEYALGSDPTKVDTSGDGLKDGQKWLMGLPLTNQDSDGDGISNQDEIANGTNPYLEDTDSDGVADGIDAFPLDSLRWAVPPAVPGDNIPPNIQILLPSGAILQTP
jgi:alpha-tubulin suppressor-like RCC1 family protein